MENNLFKIKSTKEIAASRFTIVEDLLEINGLEQPYSYVKIKPGVCVIIEYDGKFAVLKEYRYPIKSWSYEFAAGIIDEGETPAQAAKREAEEETGFVVDEIKDLGEFYPSFGATDEAIHLFYAKCKKRGDAHKELAEFISYELMSAGEVESLISSGEFRHGAGLAAWLKYKLIRG